MLHLTEGLEGISKPVKEVLKGTELQNESLIISSHSRLSHRTCGGCLTTVFSLVAGAQRLHMQPRVGTCCSCLS